MPPLNARIIVTLELEKSMMVPLCTLYFSKNGEHNVFYTLHREMIIILFMGTVIREFWEY